MFIVIEGMDGTGKTTVVNKLAQKNAWIQTKTPNSPEFRSILLDHNNLPRLSQMLIFFADMVDVDHNIIQPNLKMGQTVICDRWYLSTQIYQIRDNPYYQKLQDGLKLTKPDYTFVLDLPVKAAMQRINKRDRYESHDEAAWNERRRAYLDTRDVIVIDTRDKNSNQIVEEICQELPSNSTC